jgi:soluble lytic murein transglycosylase-like protein
VAAAYEVGQHAKLDPTLILAIMAVESSFNPFAQSAVGAQGPDAGDDQRSLGQV